MTQKQPAASQNGRIAWLDNVKGFLILFVLLSHSYPPPVYRRFFTPFFLTMFFFVSGYTFSVRDSFPAFFRKKARRLALPLFLLGGIRMAASVLLFDGGVRIPLFLERLFGLFLQRSGKYDEMWFLSCLFLANMIFYGVLNAAAWAAKNSRIPLSESGQILFLSFCCLSAGFFIRYVPDIRLPWETELALIMTPYMALGCLYRRFESLWADAARRKSSQAVLLLSCAVYGGVVFYAKNDVDIHMEEFANPLVFLFLSLIVIPPVLSLCKFLSQTFLGRPLSFLGQNSLFYFAFGGFIRILFYAVTDRIGLSGPYVLSILCALSTAALLAYPAEFVRRRIPWLVGL